MGISDQRGSYAIDETEVGRSSISSALFSKTQQRVLGLLFSFPDRSFFTTEVIDRVGTGRGSVQRELSKLAESGLVTVTKVGNQKHFQANSASPIFTELCGIIRKTVGVYEPMSKALEPIANLIELALIYGSVAKGQEAAASDLDLLIVSDHLTLEQVFQQLASTETTIGRRINPTLYSCQEFERRRKDKVSFLSRVLAERTIVLFGDLPV